MYRRIIYVNFYCFVSTNLRQLWKQIVSAIIHECSKVQSHWFPSSTLVEMCRWLSTFRNKLLNQLAESLGLSSLQLTAIDWADGSITVEEIVNCLLACAIPFQRVCVSIFTSNFLSVNTRLLLNTCDLI